MNWYTCWPPTTPNSSRASCTPTCLIGRNASVSYNFTPGGETASLPYPRMGSHDLASLAPVSGAPLLFDDCQAQFDRVVMDEPPTTLAIPQFHACWPPLRPL